MYGTKAHRGSCHAVGSDGRYYTIEKWVDVVQVGDSESGPAVKDGMAEYVTSDGQHLNRLDRDTFQTVFSGMILTVVDPVP